ncbi:MAG: prepilin-type N-terminal cleavage/methylation domain-containing protein [Gammaproteobacteria bacterium]|nr:prepilin-type N-terminal cleavage/methylation domain-containing protein [Gammaproteobacteria bacterium]
MISGAWIDSQIAPPRQQGFSLLEVLVSITLLSVAMTLLLGGLRFTSRAWDAGERVSLRTADLETVHRVFGTMVGRLFPMSLYPGEDEDYAFIGETRRLRFPAMLPPFPAMGGLNTVEFSIDHARDKDLLFVNLTPFVPDAFAEDQLPEDQHTLLLETSQQISFAYLGDQDQTTWNTQWTDTTVMPRFIKIQFRDGESHWPDLIKQIPIDADLACVYPDLGGHCRFGD